MIANFIVISTILLGVIYFLSWVLVPSIRKSIEKPKYLFEKQLKRYDDYTETQQNNLHRDE